MERGIGQLKRRVHVLHGEVRLSPDKTCQVIVACCILHNICKDRQIPCPLDGDLDDNQQNDGLNVQNGQQNDRIRYRQLFAETHYWLVGIWVKTNIHVGHLCYGVVIWIGTIYTCHCWVFFLFVYLSVYLKVWVWVWRSVQSAAVSRTGDKLSGRCDGLWGGCSLHDGDLLRPRHHRWLDREIWRQGELHMYLGGDGPGRLLLWTGGSRTPGHAGRPHHPHGGRQRPVPEGRTGGRAGDSRTGPDVVWDSEPPHPIRLSLRQLQGPPSDVLRQWLPHPLWRIFYPVGFFLFGGRSVRFCRSLRPSPYSFLIIIILISRKWNVKRFLVRVNPVVVDAPWLHGALSSVRWKDSGKKFTWKVFSPFSTFKMTVFFILLYTGKCLPPFYFHPLPMSVVVKFLTGRNKVNGVLSKTKLFLGEFKMEQI